MVVYLGGYLAARFLIPDRKTLRRTVKVLAVVCVIQGVCMTGELFSHQNVFATMGANSPSIREGHVRAEGTMGGLYAGAFAGVLIPVFLWLWTEKGSRMAAAAGIAGASAIVLASHASTAWLAYGGSLLALSLWPLRKHMRVLRWGIVATLVSLHLVMHGPVWSLIEHIDLTGGSSSYHRYMLVDNCIRHFSDWWLVGYRYYGDWGFDMWDLCNQFVVAAVGGGLLTLVVFIAIYSRSFGAIGTAREDELAVIVHKNGSSGAWVHHCSLMWSPLSGINYMYHLIMCFFTLLVCISVSTLAVRSAPIRADMPDREDLESCCWLGREHDSIEGLNSSFASVRSRPCRTVIEGWEADLVWLIEVTYFMQPKSNVEWHKWAKVDPLYGIASRTGRSQDGDHPWTLAEFFEYGALNWSEYLPRWSRYGLDRRSCVEIGCGAGRITRQLVQCFGTVYAVDISPDMLTLARQHVDGAKFLLSDGVSLPLPDASVSAAFSCEVFQHFDDRNVALGYFREIHRVLRGGGTIMIHLPIAVLPLRRIVPAMGQLQESLWRLTEKWVRTKANIKRWLISYRNRRPFFYMVQYEPQWLLENLTRVGFTEVEIQLFAPHGRSRAFNIWTPAYWPARYREHNAMAALVM